jgi:hypothetical protein
MNAGPLLIALMYVAPFWIAVGLLVWWATQ